VPVHYTLYNHKINSQHCWGIQLRVFNFPKTKALFAINMSFSLNSSFQKLFLRLNTTDPIYQEVICTLKNSKTWIIMRHLKCNQVNISNPNQELKWSTFLVHSHTNDRGTIALTRALLQLHSRSLYGIYCFLDSISLSRNKQLGQCTYSGVQFWMMGFPLNYKYNGLT
jgi:hypothetical protein